MIWISLVVLAIAVFMIVVGDRSVNFEIWEYDQLDSEMKAWVDQAEPNQFHTYEVKRDESGYEAFIYYLSSPLSYVTLEADVKLKRNELTFDLKAMDGVNEDQLRNSIILHIDIPQNPDKVRFYFNEQELPSSITKGAS